MEKNLTKTNLMEELVKNRQLSIVNALEEIDTKSFQTDTWQRDGGGGGITKVLQGTVFEKAGVNTSSVSGIITESEAPMFQQLMKKAGATIDLTSKTSFNATGISLVIHPINPFVPTVHANYRFFEMENEHGSCWWFGGGADLTPYYLFEDDCTHFHRIHQGVCETYQKGAYHQFKKECDNYFYIKHRKETRGVGGIFFDYLNDNYDELFDFIKAGSGCFIDAYLPIVKNRMNLPYTENHKKWQSIRRGRYAEFNLVYDRGTLFGLKTNGRIESILMSMPPMAEWRYDYQPEEGSDEAKLQTILLNPRDWV